MSTNPHRYLDIVMRHIEHWNPVDADLDRPIRIGDFGLMELRFQRDVLAEVVRDLHVLTANVDVLRAHRDVLCRRLWNRHVAFHQWSIAAPTSWTSTIISDFEATARMWSERNAATNEHFVVSDGVGLPEFTEDVVALKTVFHRLADAEEAEQMKMQDRETLFGSISQKLSGYHEAIRSTYPADHLFVLSAPLLDRSPSVSSPAPVLSAQWDEEKTCAVLEWTLSSDPMIKWYQVRRSNATPYDPALEVTVETFEAPIMQCATRSGVDTPGGTAFFRVCGMTEAGGECHSNTVAVTHPEMAGLLKV